MILDSLPQRISDKISPCPNTGCWWWTGAVNPTTGYGVVWYARKTHLAHRWVYEQMRGPIPEGLHIDHLCRSRGCVNPDHLEPVTPRENALRGFSPGVVAWRTDTCSRGHSDWYTGGAGSTWEGKRKCRVCLLAYQKQRNKKDSR